MSTSFDEIGERLRRLRKASGRTQQEFAESLGISLRAYKNYESGGRELPSSVVMRLCEISSVSPSWILNGRKDDLDHEAVELLTKSLVLGLHLLRTQTPTGSSEDWAEFLAILLKTTHSQGVPINSQDAERILRFKEKP